MPLDNNANLDACPHYFYLILMQKRWPALLLLGLIVTGCAVWPAGEDPKGKELKAQASTVLSALIAYNKDHGAYPSSLQELAPKYLPAIPFAPGLDLDEYTGTIRFTYSASWPQVGKVECFAKLGASEWNCIGNL